MSWYPKHVSGAATPAGHAGRRGQNTLSESGTPLRRTGGKAASARPGVALVLVAHLLMALLLAACGNYSAPDAGSLTPEDNRSNLSILTTPNVSSVDELRAALADVTVPEVILAAGPYLINDPGEATVTGQLTVTRPVIIRAAHGLSPEDVVIDAEGGSRVFHVNPGADNTVELAGITITGGSAGIDRGGGVFVQTGSLTVRDSHFLNNSGISGGAISTGLNVPVQHVALLGSLFQNNTSSGTGGAVYLNTALNVGTLLVSGSTFTGNQAAGDGAAIYNWRRSDATTGACNAPATSTIVNSTFTGNTGGTTFDNTEGAAHILFTTIAGNAGAGLFSFNDSWTCARVGHSIIAGNTGADVTAFTTTQRYVSLGYNLLGTAGSHVDYTLDFVEDPPGTSSFNVANPELHALANHGGSTPTRTPELTSPAVDSGVAADDWSDYLDGLASGANWPTDIEAFVRTTLQTDQRGLCYSRVQGANSDIGAVELQSPAIALSTDPSPLVPFEAGQLAFSVAYCDALPASGNMAVTLDGSTVADDPLAGGILTVPATLAPGSYPVTASYTSDMPGVAIGTGNFVLVVPVASGTLQLSVEPAVIEAGGAATLSATFTPGFSAPASFYEGDIVTFTIEATPVTTLGTAPFTGGTATLGVAAGVLPAEAGEYNVTASYAGSASIAPAMASATLAVTGEDGPQSASLSISLGSASPDSVDLSGDSATTVVAQLALTVPVDSDGVELQQLTFDLASELPAGTPANPGVSTANLGTLAIRHDQNGNGIADEGEMELGSTTVLEDGVLTITFDQPLTIQAGQTTHLLISATPASNPVTAAALTIAAGLGLAGGLLLLRHRRAGNPLRHASDNPGKRDARRSAVGASAFLALTLVIAACGTRPPPDGGEPDPVTISIETRITGATATASTTTHAVQITGLPLDLPVITITVEPEGNQD